MSNEYAKSGGDFGVVDTNPNNINEYLLKDELDFPLEMVKQLNFFFEGSKDDKELGDNLADFQMMYFGWRLVSEKLYKILKDRSEENVYFHPVEVSKENIPHKYYIMQFKPGTRVSEEDIRNNVIFPENHLMCSKEGSMASFIVSERVKDELENNNITGMEFERLNSRG